LAVLVLLAILVAEWWLLGAGSRNARMQAELAPLDMGALQLPEQAERSLYANIREYPLFSPTRSPAVNYTPVVEENPLSDTWQLSSIIDTGASIYAIFYEVDGNRRLRLERGMSLDNWTLDSLNPRNAVLVNGTRREVFSMGENTQEPEARDFLQELEAMPIPQDPRR
jgi:hypothetical protein